MKLNLSWLLPFIIFAFGYILMGFLTHVPELSTPDLIGKSVTESLSILSSHNLNARILKEKESLDLPENIVLSQTPNPKNKIKQNQSVFLVISKRPNPEEVPSVMGLSKTELDKLAENNKIKTKINRVPSIYPSNTVISQEPAAGSKFHDLKNKSLTVYISESKDNLKLFPNLKGMQISKVIDFLRENNLKFEVYHDNYDNYHDRYNGYINESHTCIDCEVVEQRPLAGSFVDPKKNFTVYLTVNLAVLLVSA